MKNMIKHVLMITYLLNIENDHCDLIYYFDSNSIATFSYSYHISQINVVKHIIGS